MRLPVLESGWCFSFHCFGVRWWFAWRFCGWLDVFSLFWCLRGGFCGHLVVYLEGFVLFDVFFLLFWCVLWLIGGLLTHLLFAWRVLCLIGRFFIFFWCLCCDFYGSLVVCWRVWRLLAEEISRHTADFEMSRVQQQMQGWSPCRANNWQVAKWIMRSVGIVAGRVPWRCRVARSLSAGAAQKEGWYRAVWMASWYRAAISAAATAMPSRIWNRTTPCARPIDELTRTQRKTQPHVSRGLPDLPLLSASVCRVVFVVVATTRHKIVIPSPLSICTRKRKPCPSSPPESQSDSPPHSLTHSPPVDPEVDIPSPPSSPWKARLWRA